MSTADERLKILTMIAEGKITAEEGARLLGALHSAESRTATAEVVVGGPARTLRVRVTDGPTGKTKVNINIPLSLLNVAVRIGARFAPDLEGLDFAEVVDMINQGARGKIIDVADETDDERVEIFVE
jgi:hypothetical protein